MCSPAAPGVCGILLQYSADPRRPHVSREFADPRLLLHFCAQGPASAGQSGRKGGWQGGPPARLPRVCLLRAATACRRLHGSCRVACSPRATLAVSPHLSAASPCDMSHGWCQQDETCMTVLAFLHPGELGCGKEKEKFATAAMQNGIDMHRQAALSARPALVTESAAGAARSLLLLLAQPCW